MTTDIVFSVAEIAKHNDEKSLWVIIHGSVYDVTKYANEHPGGMGVLLEHAGMDGTDDFEDVGHSSDAREIMASMKIGVIESVEKTDKECGCAWKRRLLMPVAAVAVMGLAFLVYKLTRRTF